VYKFIQTHKVEQILQYCRNNA